MITYNKNNRTLRIEKRLEELIIKFINFLNQELMVNKISITAFMEEFVFKGINYYMEVAYQHCTLEKQREELDGISGELKVYWENLPYSGKTDTTTRTLSIDSETFELLKVYVRLENAVWKRDWTLNGLLIGGMMNGLEFYLSSDLHFINSNDVATDYDYSTLIQDIRQCIARKKILITFRDGKEIED